VDRGGKQRNRFFRKGEIAMNNVTKKNRLNQFFPPTWSEVDTLLNQFLSPGTLQGERTYYAPASVWEADNAYHVELDVPGVAREAIDLTFDKGTLSIAVERKAPEQDRSRWHEERAYGKAIREIALSKKVDPDTISAELNSGVLHVSVAKTPETQPKRIEVN